MEILNLLIIVCSIVYIWDYSGFIFDLTKLVYKKLNKDKPYKGQSLPKPIGCTLCMVFWCVVTYGLLIMKYSIIHSIGLGVGFSILAPYIELIMGMVINTANKFK